MKLPIMQGDQRHLFKQNVPFLGADGVRLGTVVAVEFDGKQTIGQIVLNRVGRRRFQTDAKSGHKTDLLEM